MLIELTFPLMAVIFFASLLFSFFIFSFLSASKFGDKIIDELSENDLKKDIEKENVY